MVQAHGHVRHREAEHDFYASVRTEQRACPPLGGVGDAKGSFTSNSFAQLVAPKLGPDPGHPPALLACSLHGEPPPQGEVHQASSCQPWVLTDDTDWVAQEEGSTRPWILILHIR